jgi:glucuronosyltransferase
LTGIASDATYHTCLLQDIQKFLDDSEHGAIYFSLGSIVKTDTLAAEKRDAFLQAFADLPQRILWKWEADTILNKPPNVKIARWLPQVDVLRKFQCRIFHVLQKLIKPCQVQLSLTTEINFI